MALAVILASAYLISRRRAIPVIAGVMMLGAGIIGYTLYHVLETIV